MKKAAEPPVPFPDIHRVRLEADTVLHKIHHRSFAADGFNPGKGRPTRFAPLARADGSHVATAYAAVSLECAAHETIFHEIPYDASFKQVRFRTISDLRYSMVRTTAALTLAGLFEVDLNRWQLTRADLIDTLASEYERTARWALAIHDAHADTQGLVWTSRRCDPDRACVLFGDRITAGTLAVLSTRSFADDDALLSELAAHGRRAGITLTM